jgi:hypothetical protein
MEQVVFRCVDFRGIWNFGIYIQYIDRINPLAPNDVYICRNAQLTSRRCILNIYSTNILAEYFKHAAHSPFFFSSRCRLFHNAIFFGSCNIHILNTGVLKFKRKFRHQRIKISLKYEKNNERTLHEDQCICCSHLAQFL